jgi:hypothetical protein
VLDVEASPRWNIRPNGKFIVSRIFLTLSHINKYKKIMYIIALPRLIAYNLKLSYRCKSYTIIPFTSSFCYLEVCFADLFSLAQFCCSCGFEVCGECMYKGRRVSNLYFHKFDCLHD